MTHQESATPREIQHDGWLVRYDEDGKLDEVCVGNSATPCEPLPESPIRFFHLERMDKGGWWMRLDLADGRAVVINIYAKNRPDRTIVEAMVEED